MDNSGKLVIGMILVILALVGMYGAVTGRLAAMLAALFQPSALSNAPAPGSGTLLPEPLTGPLPAILGVGNTSTVLPPGATNLYPSPPQGTGTPGQQFQTQFQNLQLV